MADRRALLADALASTPSLSEHLDEDASEYILSILHDDPSDEDAREAVAALVGASVDDDGGGGAEDACAAFFRALDESLGGGGGDCGVDDGAIRPSVADVPRKLESAVTLKSRDIQTFASGLVAEPEPGADPEDGGTSDIQAFYANMIDVSNNPRAKSERERRKARQKEVRERLDEEERRRAVEDAARMMEDDPAGGGAGEASEEAAEAAASDNAADVHLTNFSLPNRKGGGPDLLTESNLVLASGRRYGLMGRNGCGKTTLLTALAARQLDADGIKGGKGGVAGGVPKNMSMLLVRQEIMGNELSAVETVLRSDVRREGVKRWIEQIEKELNKLDNPEPDDGEAAAEQRQPPSKGKQRLKDRKRGKAASAAAAKGKSSAKRKPSAPAEESVDEKRKRLHAKLSRAYDRLARVEQEEGGDPEPRARKVLFGLGFSTPEMQDKPTRELSGGWRMRVSLSCALFANPALLLLDEPTNHLDLEAVLWLERYLTRDFKGTLVVVSHDRHFLNEVVTDVVHFHRGKLTTYRGDIANFEAVRDENRKRQVRLYEQQEAKRAHLQKYIDLHAQAGENGVKASRQRKSRMKKLDKLGVMAAGEGRKFKASYDGEAEEVEAYEEDEEVVLNFPDPGGFDGNIVSLDRVSFGYTPDKVLLEDVDLTIDMKSRVALLGRNGCGKSLL
ncbi:hypothetical protein ACHAWF_014589 [Thalassiosira exigua]